MSVRVVRWDTGREHEVPEEALRWGPDTKQGTCRAQLLYPGEWVLSTEDAVLYVLPFEGAKWAVRVTLVERPDTLPADVFRHSPWKAWAPSFPLLDPPYSYRWIGDGWKTERQRLNDGAFVGHAFSSAKEGREKLGALLEAAGDALRAEAEEDRPAALGEALELLAEAIDPVVYSHAECAAFTARVRAFLERETSAEIRLAWKGGARV